MTAVQEHKWEIRDTGGRKGQEAVYSLHRAGVEVGLLTDHEIVSYLQNHSNLDLDYIVYKNGIWPTVREYLGEDASSGSAVNLSIISEEW